MSVPPGKTVEETAQRPLQVPLSTLDALVDLAPEPVWMIATDGAVQTCNSAFQRWWTDVSGSVPVVGLPLRGGAPQFGDLQQRALSGRSIMASVHLVVAGIERTYSIHARPVEAGGVAFAAREIVAEGEAGSRAVEVALLHLFDSNEPLDQLLGRTLEFLCATDHWDAAILWRIDGHLLRSAASWFDPATRERLTPLVTDLTVMRGHGPAGRAWDEMEVVWIADMLDETTRARVELAALSGLRSVVATPLADEERVTGVLELFSSAIRPINEPMRRMMARTGAALSRLIERRTLVDQIAKKGAEWLLTVDSIRMPILLVDTEGRVIRLNRTAQEFAGAGYEALVGRPLSALGREEPWTTLADTVTAVREGGMSCTSEVLAGERSWDVSANPISAADGDRVVIVLRETTEVMRLQESVRRGEQLAALGELVAGVAHEVKNPLFGMSLTLDLLDQQIGDRPEAVEMAGTLRTWIARLQSLTENLLAYGRTWTTDLKPGDVNPVITHAVSSIAHLGREAGVVIESKGGGEHQIVLMDAARLVLVFENLLANAIQHSPRGGRVTIAVDSDPTEVFVTVQDEGPGFPPDELTRIFQPFFTRRRGGTGLGLSIVQRIVDEHGGTVAASNAERGGGVVLVRLPKYSPVT